MANAIPVHQQEKPKVTEKPVEKKPAAPAVAAQDAVAPVRAVEPQIDHEQYRGKDHPIFGKWQGHGWHRNS